MPPRGPGRPVEFSEWSIAVLILLTQAKRLTTKSAQYRYLHAHAEFLASRLGWERFPARSTYFSRYQTAYLLLNEALAAYTNHAADRRQIDVRCVAADKSLVAAVGPPWHKHQRLRGKRPKGVDGEASWSKSTHHGWVFGYGIEVVVSAPRRGLNWPVSGSLDSARVREAKTFPAKIPKLPSQTRYVLVDMGYDSNELGDAVEFSDQGRPTGRHLVGPQQQRHNCHGDRKRIWRETHQRRLRRARRVKRRQFYERRFGKALYKRRSKTVEPFFARFKELFDLRDHVRHTGLENNRTQILALLVLYQILLDMNRIKGQNNAEVKWILDLL
ncbi:MAG TPA: transposase [Isosphaeraceae bacterium]|nr:transposase [Isosphaeraceae bacterium]